MDMEDDKRGFAGIADLVSDINVDDAITTPAVSPSPPELSQPAPEPTPRNETKHVTLGSPQPAENIGSGKNASDVVCGWILRNIGVTVNTFMIWLFFLIGVTLAIWLLSTRGQNSKELSYNQPQTAQNRNLPQSTQTTISPSVPFRGSEIGLPTKPIPQITREAQKLLTELGYKPGPVDGIYGPETAQAIKTFQNDLGFKKDIGINEELINLLRQQKDISENLYGALNKQDAKSPQKTVSPTRDSKVYSPVEFVRTYYQDVEKHNFESAIAKWKDPDKDKLRSLIEAVDGYHINEISLTRQTSSEAEVYVDVWAKSLKGATERWKGVVFLQDLSGQWVITKTSLTRFEESKARAEKEPTTSTSSVSSDVLVSLQGSRSQSRKTRAKEFDELKKAGFETDWVHDPIYPFKNSQKGHSQAIQNYPAEESYINPQSVESEQSLRIPAKGYDNSTNSSHLKQTTVPHPAIEQPLPYSGNVQSYTSAEKIAPFEINAAKGTNHLVKLVDAYTKAPVMTIFVRSGTTVSIAVPLGTYEVRYASGTSWYGYDYLFGPDTAYSKADRTFRFEVFGNQVSGFTITLYKVANGNLQTSAIRASEF
jgi:hypothetical protein